MSNSGKQYRVIQPPSEIRVINSEKQTTATRGNEESDCAIVSEMSVSN